MAKGSIDKLTEYAMRARIFQLETAIKNAVACSNRTWCSRWTHKHFKELSIIAGGLALPVTDEDGNPPETPGRQAGRDGGGGE